MSALSFSFPQYQYFVSTADSIMQTEYYNGLADALKKFNVDKVVLSTAQPKSSDDTYIILAKNKNDIAIGGIRIEIKSQFNSLPIEKSEIPYKKNVAEKMRQLTEQNKTIAEISGLWVNSEGKRASGFGALGPGLCLEATQLALGLGIDVLVCLPPQHTFNYFKNLGYVAPADIPPMAYPDDRYLSTFAWFFRAEPAKLKLVHPIAHEEPEHEQITLG